MESVDFVSGLHNCLEFSQLLSCLYHTENVSIAYMLLKNTGVFLGSTSGNVAQILEKQN